MATILEEPEPVEAEVEPETIEEEQTTTEEETTDTETDQTKQAGQLKVEPRKEQGSFKVTITDAKELRTILNALEALLEEVDLSATEEGFKVRSLDPSHVAMVELDWRKDAFQEYTCTGPVKIRLNMKSLSRKLKTVGSDSVELSYDDKTRKLKLESKGKWKSTFTEPTLDAGDEEPTPIPKVNLTARLRLVSSALKGMIEQIATVSDNVRLQATSDLHLTAEAATELSQATLEIDRGSDMLLEIEVKEPAKATYNLTYLQEIAKSVSAVCDIVDCEFAKDMPIKISAHIGTGTIGEGSQLTYWLAPRIETE